MRERYDTGRLGKAIAEMVKAPSIAAAWKTYCDEMTALGYNMLVYGCALTLPLGQGLRPDETLLLFNGPDDWAERIINDKLYQQSLTFEWAARNEGFASWQDALKQFGVHPSPRVIELYDTNGSFGLHAGHIGSLRDLVPGKHGVFGLSGPYGTSPEINAAHWLEVGAWARTLCETLHLRIVSLPHQELFRPLTSRQLEVLYWYGEGKMLQDIATIMDIRIGTVEKHLRMARQALVADTTAHAVRKATALNLLTA